MKYNHEVESETNMVLVLVLYIARASTCYDVPLAWGYVGKAEGR